MSTPRCRANTIDELQRLLGRLFVEKEIAQGLKLTLSSADVVITPFAKSGTTWLQQMVHTLRTKGDMEFDDISRVVPWIETSRALGLDIHAEQRAKPRAFKSHLDYEAIPKGGRYINSVRHPGDVLVSFYKFMEGWLLEPGSVSIDEFADQHFIPSGAYWRHLRSWWPQRHSSQVLFLAYEQMIQQPVETIQRVAEFIEVPLDDDLAELTSKHTSMSFMLRHKNKFDDAMMRELSEVRCDLPANSDSAKVRKGEVGAHRQHLSAKLLNRLEEQWQQQIAKPLGLQSYDALLSELQHS